MIIKKATSLLLAAFMAASCVAAGGIISFADSVGNPDGVYVKQISSGKCTLASATMMLRQKSLDEGNPTWNNITQSSVRKYGWVEGTGIKQSFTYYGISVERRDLTGYDNRGDLLELLAEHEEGIVIYDRGVPHAVLLTRYDADEDIFYCADPGLSDQEMKLSDSWLKKGATGQENIINAVDCVWVIASYSMKDIPSEEDTGSLSGDTDGNSGNAAAPDDNTGDGDYSGSDVLVDDDDSSDSTDGKSDAVRNDDDSAAASEVFAKVRSYDAAGFSDVDLTEWYAPYVRSAYETGLMSGLSGVKAGTFGINGNMTLAQAVTLASRIYSRYAGDNESFTQNSGDSWTDPYMRYAERNNIISAQVADSDAAALDQPVTRAQFAEIINAAVGDDACASINAVTGSYFSDIYESGTTGRAVYRLCRAGIITGDSKGNFNPDASISRAQVAAIVARITDESLRVRL